MTPRPTLRLVAWRARFVLVAVLAAAACAVVVGQLRPAPEATVPVWVAAGDLPAGARLAGDDVRTEPWPVRLAPAGAQDDPVGRTLTVAVPAGLPLVDELLGAGLGADAPPGTVVAPVRLTDPGIAALLRPGDRVDVIAAGADDGASTVARGALVLAGPSGTESDGTLGGLLSAPGTDGGAPVLLAVRPAEARTIAGAAAMRAVTVVLVE